MADRALLLAACLAFALVGGSVKADDCTLKEYASFDLGERSGGIYTLPVSIGASERPFAVELGEGYNYIASPVADALRLPRRKLPESINVQAHDEVGLNIVKVDRTQLAHLSLEGLEYIEIKKLDDLDPDIAGTLGLSVLALFDVDLDLSAHKLKLFSQDHCPGKVVYWAPSYAAVPFSQQPTGIVVLPMTLDGQKVDVGLESDRSHSVMPMSTATRLFGITVNSPGLVPVAGNPNRFRYSFKSLSVGGLSVQNPKIEIYNEDRPTPSCKGALHMTGGREFKCFGQTDIQLVVTELKQLHLFFAFKEKTLYLTAANGSTIPPSQ